jgi:hypothetical protein
MVVVLVAVVVAFVAFYLGKAVGRKHGSYDAVKSLKEAVFRDAGNGKSVQDIIAEADDSPPASDLMEALDVVKRFKA